MSAPAQVALPQRLADAFTDLVRDELTVEELLELRARNEAYTGSLTCASHEYLDATDRMALAFRAVLGRARDDSSASDTELWDAGWRLAKEAQFKRPLQLMENAEGEPAYTYSIRGMAIEDPYLSECGQFKADPAKDYGLMPQEAAELVEANARLARETAAKWQSVRKRYPKLETYHTGGGCMALRLECAGESYILITDADGARLPGKRATEVAVGRYAASGDTWSDAETVSLDALSGWIDNAVSEAANPQNVGDYFVVKLGEAPSDESLHTLPIDAPCGEDCRKVIDAAVALIEHIRAALGRDGRILLGTRVILHTPESVVVAIASQVIGVYWHG
jgi:hypothetical protein